MQYVLEAHREFIRSKLSSNQSRNLNMIVNHKKTHYSLRFRVFIFSPQRSTKKKHFFFGGSVCIYSTFVSKHVSTTAEHFPHAKAGILGQVEALENNTKNNRSKCNLIIQKHAETYTNHHFSWTNNIQLRTKNESFEAELELPNDI